MKVWFNPSVDKPKVSIQDFTEPGDYKEGQPVDLVIKAETDLGYKAIVNDRHWGVLYYDEVFRKISENEKIKGFIKQIRGDGKLDLTLDNPALARHQKAQDIGPKILKMLEGNGGFLTVTEKTPPDEIYEMFGVSKKKYKIALGGLYKQRLIAIEDGGIRLVKQTPTKR